MNNQKTSTENSTRQSGSSSATCSAAWSETPPTEPGHYWVRFGHGEKNTLTVLEVENWHGKLQSYYFQYWRPLADNKYWNDVEWWSQAIMPPNVPMSESPTKTP
jgi:hypothetical protein